MKKYMTINGVNFQLLTGQRAKDLHHEYEYAMRRGATSLGCVYDSWSNRKQEAYNDCLETKQKVNGAFMYISSWNDYQFCVVYTLVYDYECYIVKETRDSRFIARA